MKVVEECI